MAALEAVIARLDIRRAQVLVEAIIVEIDVTEGRAGAPVVVCQRLWALRQH